MESLRLEWRSPSELAENPRNWRRHPDAQIEALADVIGEVGWAGACLFNERTQRLIDGHARRKVAEANGSDKVPVLVGSWSEEDERKILATFDPISTMATTDAAALESLLREVNTQSEAINGMLEGLAKANPVLPEPGGGGDEFDATPEDKGPTRTAGGETWIIGGKHRLYVGDCTGKGNVERLMAGSTPLLMVTDPPYGVEYDAAWRDEAAAAGLISHAASRVAPVTNDDREDWTEAYKLFTGNVVYCWHAGRRASSIQSHLESAGFEIRCQIVWAKQTFAISRGHYHWQHEPCWYAVRKGETAEWIGDRSQSTLWSITWDKNVEGGHSTQKPVECMARAIRNHEGDVYDPFLGSGTTLIAAHRLSRVCYGCEIEPRYADVILKRAEAEGLTVEKQT